MRFIRTFTSEEFAQGLAGWSWLRGLEGLSPLFTTAFGDVFFAGQSGVWHLDLGSGDLRQRWASEDALWAAMDTEHGQDTVLDVTLVMRAHSAGLRPGGTEILALRLPEVLGGNRDLDNLEVSPFTGALALAGQIHRQVREAASAP